MDQAAGLLPPGFGVDHSGWSAPPDGCEVQPGELVAFGPADEVSRAGAVAYLRGGQPCFQVALVGRGQSETAGGEPVEQGDGGLDDPLGGDDLAAGGVSTVQPGAQPAGHLPDGVAVQQLLLVRVAPVGDGGGDPAFQPGELFIAGCQCAGGDQDAAQMLDCLAGRQFVESVVAQGLGSAGERPQDRRGGAVVQPGLHGAWSVGPGERLIEGLQLGREVTGLVADQVAQLPLDRAARAPGVVDPAAFPAVWAAAPKPRFGAGAGGAQRRGERAAADGPLLAAGAAAGPPVPARFAPGFAGRLGDVARPVLPADGAGHGRDRPAFLAQRASGRTDADTSPLAAADAGFLVGGVADQAVRAQRLAVLVAGGRFADLWVPNIVSPHATWAYSWMRPPSRSRLKTLNVLGGVGQSLPFGGR